MENIKFLISEGKIKEAIEQILLACSGRKYEKESTLLSARYETLSQESRKGVISNETYQTKLNIIIDSSLQLLEKIEADDSSKHEYTQKNLIRLLMIIFFFLAGGAIVTVSLLIHSNKNSQNMLYNYEVHLIDSITHEKLYINNDKLGATILYDSDSMLIPINNGKILFSLNRDLSQKLVELHIEGYHLKHRKIKIKPGIDTIEIVKQNTIGIVNPKNANEQKIKKQIVPLKLDENGQKNKKQLAPLTLDENHILSGLIVDEHGQPINDVKVYTLGSPNSESTTVGGEFRIQIDKNNAENIRLFAEKIGYIKWNEYVNSSQKNLVIKLKSNNE